MKLEIERDLHIDADCVASESNEYVAKELCRNASDSDQPTSTVRRDLHCVLSVSI